MTSPILNPRAVAYCRAVGIPATVEALRARDGNYSGFMAWIAVQARAFNAARGAPRRDYPLPSDDAAFTAFCEAAADRAAAEACRG